MIKYWKIIFKPGLLFVLIVGIFISCESSIFKNQVAVDDAIVVNSLITSDSLFSCHLSKLADPLAENYEFVNDAKVCILNAETKDTVTHLLSTSEGWYYSQMVKPEAEVNYQLVVELEGFDRITAETTIPIKGKAKNIIYELYAAKDETTVGEETKVATISLIIDDPEKIENYYELDLIKYKPHVWLVRADGSLTDEKIGNATHLKPGEKFIVRNDTLIEYDLSLAFNCTDAAFLNEKLSYKWITSPSILLSDNLFDGTEKLLTSNLENGNSVGYVLLIINTLSKDLFKYKTSVVKQQWEEGEKEFDPFGGGFNIANDHVHIHSNIKNGYGIFAGFNTQKYHVKAVNGDYWWEKESQK